jgi:hypothetical protein
MVGAMPGEPNASRGARRADRRRRPLRSTVLSGVALLVSGVAVYVGLLGGSGDGPAPTARSSADSSPSADPTGDLDLSGLSIARAPFCDRLDESDVEAALGGPVARTGHYDDGETVRLSSGVTDVSHEHSCTFTAADGTQARVWVFAMPVTRGTARQLVREARRERGCTPQPDSATYGRPGMVTVCRTGTPTVREVTMRGLFGDAWLTCRLSGTGRAGEVARRGEQWCLRVATTLGARPE